MRRKAFLISFEGGEKCGKSTQIPLLAKALRRKGLRVKVLREPGATRVGEEIRKILLHRKKDSLSPLVEFQLFTAARRQLVDEILYPFLQKDKGVVILDRFFDSTYVYQGIAGGLNLKRLKSVEEASRRSLVPDITFLLDLPLSEIVKRTGKNKDRMERKPKSYHQKVRNGFLKRAKAEKRRFVVVDGSRTIQAIQNDIYRIVERRLGIF